MKGLKSAHLISTERQTHRYKCVHVAVTIALFCAGILVTAGCHEGSICRSFAKGTAAATPLARLHRSRNNSASQDLVGPGPAAAAAAAAAKLSQLSQLPHSRWTDGWLADRLEGLPCNQSGYCSLASVKEWSGDITTKDGLMAAVQARGFVHGAGERPEVILVLGGSNDLPAALNLHLGFRKLGLDNVLFMADSEETCRTYTKALNNSGCAWYSRRPHTGLGKEEMWQHVGSRWWTMARLVRLGVNVLSLDTDVQVVADPYLYFKRGPFASKHLLVQKDDPWSGAVNCGMVYVQNAARDGPAAWILAELEDRSVRVWENIPGVKENFPLKDGFFHFTWEQAMWNDILRSAIIGAYHK